MASTEIVDRPQAIPGIELKEQLGEGQFGTVWETEQPGGVRGAMKISRQMNGLYAIREWESLKSVMNLKHPNLCGLFAVWLKDETGKILSEEEIRALAPRPDRSRGDRRPQISTGKTGTARPLGWNPQAQVAQRDAAQLGHTMDPNDVAEEAPDTKFGDGTDPATDGLFSARKTAPKLPPLQLFIAMEKGEGTLATLVRDYLEQGQKGIPRDELLKYAESAAAGLQYLNDKGIRHCDVKPENLLLVGGAVKVCDYGSALKALHESEEVTQQGYTELYAAPEQMHRKQVMLFKSTDQYALALTYYTLRTTVAPWNKDSGATTYDVKVNEAFDFSALNALVLTKSSRDSHETRVLRKALRRNPTDRFEEVTDFVEALRSAVQRDDEELRRRKLRRRKRLLLGIGLLLVMATVVAGVRYLPPLFSDPYTKFVALIDAGKLPQAIALANKELLNDERVGNRLFSEGTQRLATAKALESSGEHIGLALELISDFSRIDPVFQTSAVRSKEEWDGLINNAVVEIWKPGINAPSPNRFAGARKLLDLPAGVSQDFDDVLTEVLSDEDTDLERIEELLALHSALEKDPNSIISQRVAELLDERINQGIASLNGYSGTAADLAAPFREVEEAIRQLKSSDLNGPYLAEIEPDAEVHACAAALLQGQQKPEHFDRLLAASNPQSIHRSRYDLLHIAWLARDSQRNAATFFDAITRRRLKEGFAGLSAGWEDRELDKALEVAIALNPGDDSKLAEDIVVAIKHRPTVRLLQIRSALVAATPDSIKTARELLDLRDHPATEDAQLAVLNAWYSLLESPPQPAQVTAALEAWEAWGQTSEPDAVITFKELAKQTVQQRIAISSGTLDVLINSTFEQRSEVGRKWIPAFVGVLRGMRASRDYVVATRDQFPQLLSDCNEYLQISNDDRVALGGGPEHGLIKAIQDEAVLENVSGFSSEQLQFETTAANDYETYLRLLAKFRSNVELEGSEADFLARPDLEPSDVFAAKHRRERMAEMLNNVAAIRNDDLQLKGGYLQDIVVDDKRFNWLLAAWKILGKDAKQAPFYTDLAANSAVLGFARLESTELTIPEHEWKRIVDWAEAGLLSKSSAVQRGDRTLAGLKRSYLVWARAQGLLKCNATTGQADSVHQIIQAVNQVLENDVDVYGEPAIYRNGLILRELFIPCLTLADRAWENDEAFRPFLTRFYGTFGALLEVEGDDALKDHSAFYADSYERCFAVYRFFYRARTSLQTDEDTETDRSLKLRWVAGELLALDRVVEAKLQRKSQVATVMDEPLSPASTVAKPINDLWKEAMESVAEGDESFIVPAARSIRTFYEWHLARERKAQRVLFTSVNDDLTKALAAMAETGQNPWLISLKAKLLEIQSRVQLQRSWQLDWGVSRRNCLNNAISYAEQAIKCYERLNEHLIARGYSGTAKASSAHAALANACEDMYLHQRERDFLPRAAAEFGPIHEHISDDELQNESDPILLMAAVGSARIQMHVMRDDGNKADTSGVEKRLKNAVKGLVYTKLVNQAEQAKWWRANFLAKRADRQKDVLEVCMDLSEYGLDPYICALACVQGFKSAAVLAAETTTNPQLKDGILAQQQEFLKRLNILLKTQRLPFLGIYLDIIDLNVRAANERASNGFDAEQIRSVAYKTLGVATSAGSSADFTSQELKQLKCLNALITSGKVIEILGAEKATAHDKVVALSVADALLKEAEQICSTWEGDFDLYFLQLKSKLRTLQATLAIHRLLSVGDDSASALVDSRRAYELCEAAFDAAEETRQEYCAQNGKLKGVAEFDVNGDALSGTFSQRLLVGKAIRWIYTNSPIDKQNADVVLAKEDAERLAFVQKLFKGSAESNLLNKNQAAEARKMVDWLRGKAQ